MANLEGIIRPTTNVIRDDHMSWGVTFRQVLRIFIAASLEQRKRYLMLANNRAAAEYAFRMARDIFYASRIGEDSELAKVNGAQQSITLPNGSTIDFRSAPDVNKLRGLDYKEVALDYL